MAGFQVFPDHEDVGRVDAALVREGVVVFLEREGQRGAIAECFFLGQGAVLPAAAGGVCVGHVEHAGVAVVGCCGVVEGKGGVDGVGVDDFDPGCGEVGTVFPVETGRFSVPVDVSFVWHVGSRGQQTWKKGFGVRCNVF